MDPIYWHMNATQGGSNSHPGVNYHPGANLHPGANCAYEHGLRRQILLLEGYVGVGDRTLITPII